MLTKPRLEGKLFLAVIVGLSVVPRFCAPAGSSTTLPRGTTPQRAESLGVRLPPDALLLRGALRSSSADPRLAAHPLTKLQRVVYVSDYLASAIVIYPQGLKSLSPIGAITDGIAGPVGTVVDSAGTLYVANFSNGTVTEYPAGSTHPSVTLSSGIDRPTALSVANDGTLYVAEFAANLVLGFKRGSSAPDVAISSLSGPEGITNDAAGNLFATSSTKSGAVISECPPLQSSCTAVATFPFYPGDIKFDRGGNVLVCVQQLDFLYLYQAGNWYSPDVIGVSGNPFRLAFNKTDRYFYVADSANGAVLIFDYARRFQAAKIYDGLSSALGVALSPAQPDPRS